MPIRFIVILSWLTCTVYMTRLYMYIDGKICKNIKLNKYFVTLNVILVKLIHGKDFKPGILILAHSTHNSWVPLVTWLSIPNISHENKLNNAIVLRGSFNWPWHEGAIWQNHYLRCIVGCVDIKVSRTIMNFFEKWSIYLYLYSNITYCSFINTSICMC